MLRKLIGKLARIPVSVAAVALIAGIVALALFLSGCTSQTAADKAQQATDVMPLAARVDRLDGDVGIARQPDTADANQSSNQNAAPSVGQAQPNTDWAKASVNAPVSVGSRVFVKEGSHAAIAFTGRNYARLNSNTSLDVLSLSQRRTQLALRQGSGEFDVGAIASGELFEVATPGGAVDFMKPGLYQVGIGDDGRTVCSVLAGSAQVVGLGGGGEIAQGRCLTFGGSGAEEVQQDAYVADLDPAVSGGIVDNYYSYRYPKTYDGRYRDYNKYLNDPYYYDPYRRSVSHQYIPDDAEVAGLDDLNDNGDWEDVPGHGHCWRPRVAAGWAPYRDGSWYNDQPLGLTWVSNENWGWAPYHYGRWSNVNHGWFWEPGEILTRPIYAPALVAFVPFPQEDRIGWVPLGPGDPYVPRYYDQNYQPRYIGTTQNVTVINVVNYNVVGAVTVVPTSGFNRVITQDNPYADPGLLARTRPVADPYGVPRIREIAPTIQAGRPSIQVPVGARQGLDRSVITSQAPIVPTVSAGTVKGLNAQAVPEAQTKRQLRINNSAQAVTAIQPNGIPAVAPQAGQNQPLTPQQQQKADRKAAAQGLQPGQPGTATQQPGQQPAATQQELKQQQKADRKAAAQQPGQQPAAQQAATQQQLKQQQKAERKAAAQQPGQQPAGQQADAQQQLKQQQKAQRKAAAQQQAPQPQPAAQQQQKQQQKAERKAAAQQQQQQSQQAAPSKADRKAEKAKNKNASQ